MKFNKNEFGWKEKVSVNTDELVTKEYVDENTQLCWLEDYEATGDRLQYADVNVSSLTSRVFYAFNFKKHPGVKTVRLLKSYDDGTIKSIIDLGSTLEYMYLMKISSSIMRFYLKYATGIVSECVCTFGNTSDECTFKRTPMVLYAKNTYEYTPTTDYNPATKKYVDDKFIAFDLMETVGTIPQSELQKCNNGTSRYVSSIDFDTLFSEPNNYMYYATYKDDTLIPIEYQSNFNRMVTNELDSADGEGVLIGFDYGTHMMYPFNGGMASIKAYTFTNDLIIKRCPLINVNEVATKKYVDDKTEILPVKNNYIIFEDAVPSRTEVASNGLEYYIFDSLQNEDMIISAVKYNLNVTFNDGTNDRTMDLIIERSLKGGAFCEKDGFFVQVSYSETNHAIEMIVANANNYTQYSILKATLNCDSYSNLLQDYHIENINYDKIKEVPTALNRIVNYKDFTLEGKEYYELYDNLSIWDANKFNERLDENSGVKRNEFFKLLGEDKYTMRIKQKDSEGIGFGQHISIDNSKNVHIVADAGVDVIIKIYNSTTKELIGTLNYCEAGFYKTRIINKDYLNGVTSIFIAFTVKDSTESFYGNTYVNDLIVHYDSSFLVKEEILTKTNTKEYIPIGDYNPATKKYVDDTISNILSFNDSGELVVTINGVSKTFVPKQ